MSLIRPKQQQQSSIVIIADKQYTVDTDVAVYIQDLWQVHQSVCTRLNKQGQALINNAGPFAPTVHVYGSPSYSKHVAGKLEAPNVKKKTLIRRR